MSPGRLTASFLPSGRKYELSHGQSYLQPLWQHWSEQHRTELWASGLDTEQARKVSVILLQSDSTGSAIPGRPFALGRPSHTSRLVAMPRAFHTSELVPASPTPNSRPRLREQGTHASRDHSQ